MEFFTLSPLNSHMATFKSFIGMNYQIPTISFQIVTFIIIGYCFPRLGIFLILIFNRQHQNSLSTPVPFFRHKSLPLKVNSYFEPFFFPGIFTLLYLNIHSQCIFPFYFLIWFFVCFNFRIKAISTSTQWVR